MAQRVTEVRIEGLSPLLMHRYPLEPVEALDKKPAAEQAEMAAYRVPDTGELYIPGTALQRCFVNGAGYSKGKGRGSLQKQVAASVLVTPEYVGLGEKTFAVDSRGVVIAATRGRVVRHRPRLDTWKAAFRVTWDDTLLSAAQLKRVLDDSGSRVGVLDFRPERKGPFGRFMVTHFEEEAA